MSCYSSAVQAMMEHKEVKREGWNFYLMYVPHTNNVIPVIEDHSYAGWHYTVTKEDQEATDWVGCNGEELTPFINPFENIKTPEQRIAELESQLKQVLEVLNAKS